MQMTTTQHQQMGYDRAASMFAPDGRLLQVEYANKTVKQGTTTIALKGKDGVVLVADKRVNDPLMVAKSREKIYQIDEHIMASVTGLVADGTVLIDRAQVKAQQHRVSYETESDIISIVKDTCSVKQNTTQAGGYRPFGVAMIFAGVDDDGAQIYVTEPSGVHFEYKACAIGEHDEHIKQKLKDLYSEDNTIEKNIKLAVDILKELKKDSFNIDLLDIAVVETKDREFKRLDPKSLKL